MSKQYTNAVATYYTKRQSRNKVAKGIKDTMKENSVIHYLGGTSTQTPFENKFKNNDVTFVRYERMKSFVPNGYKQVTFDNTGNANLPEKGEKGYFVNGDFFDCFWSISEKLNADYSKEEHYWLDFCGMPKSDLLEMIYYTFLFRDESLENWNFKSLYLTFFLNPRSCKEVQSMFANGEKTLEERAQTLLAKIKGMVNNDNFNFEVFDTYMNGISPMAVLKIERRDTLEDMTKTASINNYVNLHKRGFTNKQIAIFWRAGIMQVEGFAAQAKRKGMI
jgi:hypothetical protein